MTQTAKEGEKQIEDLIDRFAKTADDELFIDLLDEMIERATTAKEARLEEKPELRG